MSGSEPQPAPRESAPAPSRAPAGRGSVRAQIVLQARDLGGLPVGRVLPIRSQRRVGPFIFFDHMGPTEFAPGEGLDVLPHPHINLATLTYLFEGAITHRDSLGSHQVIRPGAVNWMHAGPGIVHSERTPPAERAAGSRLHGIQLWVGLPQAEEERAPSFQQRRRTRSRRRSSTASRCGCSSARASG